VVVKYDLLIEFASNIQVRQLLNSNDKVLVAVSGGPDSMALLHLLYRLGTVSLGVFHLHHQLRAAADEEAEYVAQYAAQLQLQCHLYRYDVARYAQEQKLSVETSAREIRYRLLRECMEKYGYTKVALGHHKDDQAETVLMHLIRGSGLTGLSGMKAQRDCFIRPLLPFSSEQILSYCHAFNLKYYHDHTNFSTEYARNKLRLELIPLIEREYNSQFRHHLVQLAAIVEADDRELTEQTLQLLPKLTYWEYGVLHLRREEFSQLSTAFQRRVLQMCATSIRNSVPWYSLEHIEKLRELIGNHNIFTYKLPQLTVYGLANSIMFGEPELPAWEPAVLPVPGELVLGNYHIKSEILAVGEDITTHANSEDFDYDQLKLPLFVRKRQAGDQMCVFGQHSAKKLKDLLIDAKVPRIIRDHIPVVCDQEDIIWVCGIRRSEKGRITSTTKKILRLTLEGMNHCHNN